MTEIKAHIVLDPSIGEDPKAREETLAQVIKASGLAEVNQERLEELGIITGKVRKSSLDAIRKIPGVLSVNPDTKRSLR
jgi:hypothetical protein